MTHLKSRAEKQKTLTCSHGQWGMMLMRDELNPSGTFWAQGKPQDYPTQAEGPEVWMHQPLRVHFSNCSTLPWAAGGRMGGEGVDFLALKDREDLAIRRDKNPQAWYCDLLLLTTLLTSDVWITLNSPDTNCLDKCRPHRLKAQSHKTATHFRCHW